MSRSDVWHLQRAPLWHMAGVAGGKRTQCSRSDARAPAGHAQEPEAVQMPPGRRRMVLATGRAASASKAAGDPQEPSVCASVFAGQDSSGVTSHTTRY
jgi:hypothetical protein